jgi:cytochrome b involved in lipid metabolism
LDLILIKYLTINYLKNMEEETKKDVGELEVDKGSGGIRVAILVVVALVVIVFGKQLFGKGANEQTTKMEITISPTPTPTVITQVISMTEIEKHVTKEDCWFVVEGKVYDVTKYIASGMHKGGDAILQGCGKDATKLFNTRPMGSGTPHSDKARGYMENFQIGLLQN